MSLEIEFELGCGCSKSPLKMSRDEFKEKILPDVDSEGIRLNKGEGFFSDKCSICQCPVFIPNFMELIQHL